MNSCSIFIWFMYDKIENKIQNKMNCFRPEKLLWLVPLGLLLMVMSCSQNPPKDAPPPLKEEITNVLQGDVVNLWYPLVIDTEYGGFLSDFDYKWDPDGPQDKMIVSQARHVWTLSKLAQWYPDESYAEYATHGVKFLKNVMWDQEFGGFHSLVKQDGQSVSNVQWGGHKTAYGNSFGIYGLAAYVMATKDTEALEFAKQAFRWLDAHSYDPVYGGYFQFLTREGDPLTLGFEGTPAKDQNSSIHLLEAFSELYQVWPNDTLKSRLQSMLSLIRDTITTEKGHLTLFLHQDLTPLSFKDSLPEIREQNYNLDHVSFGHDVETAYLMMEASEVLGLEHDKKTLQRGKQMVDHALDHGWDHDAGGFYDAGYYIPGTEGVTIVNESKAWWSQVEALNTFLIMSRLYPEDPRDYYQKFTEQWAYIKTNLLDPEYGGVYVDGIDTEPESKTRAKGGIWKVNYHTARSLMNCIKNLE